MSDSDEIGGGAWSVSPETRRALRLSAARTAVRKHDFRRAVIEAEELLDEVPDDRDALWTLAESTMELRDFEVALEAWRALIATGVTLPSALTQLGVCAFETCAFEDAAQAARSALALFDDLPDAWYLLGLCTEHLEDDERAWACFERAHRGSPLAFPLPLPLGDDDVLGLVREALTEVSREVAAFWAPVPVRIARLPTLASLTMHVPPISPRVLALVEGEPPTDPTSTARPTALHVFRANVAHSETREHALDAVADALEQLVADWFPED
jgi:tetratricopeptide (TPR) repeat protein